MIRDWYSRCEQ